MLHTYCEHNDLLLVNPLECETVSSGLLLLPSLCLSFPSSSIVSFILSPTPLSVGLSLAVAKDGEEEEEEAEEEEAPVGFGRLKQTEGWEKRKEKERKGRREEGRRGREKVRGGERIFLFAHYASCTLIFTNCNMYMYRQTCTVHVQVCTYIPFSLSSILINSVCVVTSSSSP